MQLTEQVNAQRAKLTQLEASQQRLAKAFKKADAAYAASHDDADWGKRQAARDAAERAEVDLDHAREALADLEAQLRANELDELRRRFEDCVEGFSRQAITQALEPFAKRLAELYEQIGAVRADAVAEWRARRRLVSDAQQLHAQIQAADPPNPMMARSLGYEPSFGAGEDHVAFLSRLVAARLTAPPDDRRKLLPEGTRPSGLNG